MSYPRNAASPPEIAIGAILQTSDGAQQTSGASVRVKIGSGSWGAGAGTLACDATSGIWTYAPTQAETNATYFLVGVYKSGCGSIEKTVITSASDSAGYAGVDWAKVANPTTTLGLSGTTVKAVTDAPADSAGVTTLLTRIPSTLFAGITYLARWLGAIAGKTADSGTLAEIQATTAGTSYNNTTDSLEAQKDNYTAPPSASASAAAVRTELATELARIDVATSTRLASSSYTAPLSESQTRAAVGLAAADLDSQLDAVLAAASDTTGAGAYTRTITVNDGTAALQGAKVRLTQGAESYVGTTNASGQVVFSVDAATWSVAITKPGYTFTPTTLVVSGSGSTTYSMTASGPTPSSDPDKTTVRITCYGADTEPEASATVQLRQLTAPSGDEGNAFDGAWATYTADAEGIVDVTLWSDATYAIRRGTTGDPKQFTPTGATDSFASVLSR